LTMSVDKPTLACSHEECLAHEPGEAFTQVPEKPERLRAVLRGLHALESDLKAFGIGGLEVKNLITSKAMDTAVSAHVNKPYKPPSISSLDDEDGLALERSESVAFLEQFVARSISEVHTPEYLEHLRKTVAEANDLKLTRSLTGLNGDTYASSRSLHAAVSATHVVCKAVQQVLIGMYRNAFCAVRPPGHHAGSSGGTCLGCDEAKKLHQDLDALNEATDHAEADLGQCGQGFCLLNNVAIAAKYALDYHRER